MGWETRIPKDDLTISELLRSNVPKLASMDCNLSKPLPPIHTLFAKQEPERFQEALLESVEIPSASYISILRKLVREAQKQGFHSVNSGIPGTVDGVRYPLWAVHYWEKMSFPAASKAAWADSVVWAGAGHTCLEEFISSMPWMSPVATNLPFSLNDLPILLSNEWLNDNHLDFFASHLNGVVNTTVLNILITTLPFSNFMNGRSQVSTMVAHTLHFIMVIYFY